MRALKLSGETVAATGHSQGDALVLKRASLGFSMGISGTQEAVEASDVILMDDNFASILQCIRWGGVIRDGMSNIIKVHVL